MHIGDELELFEQKKPGLSAYAKDPQQAADSLVPLLEKAEGVVPKELRHRTPVRVGATAGLRALGSETSEQILQAVRELLQHKSSLKFQPNWVTVLNGTQEGSFQWVTINYLLRRLGKSYASTVGVVDLGGGSVQIAYAISQEDAEKAPKVSDGEDSYVQKLFLKSTQYYLYVHSYLHYGLLAARAEILKVSGDGSNWVAIMVGFVDRDKPVSNVKPADFEKAATRACQLNVEDAKAAFLLVQADNLPYLCMDLTYQYTLLVDGFGIDPHQVITLMKQVPYGDASVEAAWPLGSAIEVASSSS